MGHYLVLFSFWCFVAFVAALVIRAIIANFSKPADVPKPIDPHKHEWRQITPFVRQCGIRECSEVEFGDSVPDGMTEYVKLMTSRQARIDPNGEASHYHELDSRAWGPKCPACNRVIGFPWNLPSDPFPLTVGRALAPLSQCPYCQKILTFNNEGKKWGEV